MTAAVGIHAHPTKKLGKRPPKRAATLQLSDFLTTIPDHPVVDPAPVPVNGFPMDRNDQAGDCVVAGLDHALQAIAVQLGVPRKNWTDAQLLAYYQTQNPGFTDWSQGGTAADGGMDIQTFLEHLVSTGDILAFGAVDHTDREAMRAAVYVGLAVVTGETLDVAQQKQQVWDWVKSSPTWGGHCTTAVSYDTGDQGLVTWGEVVEATDAFFAHQVEETWFVLTTDLVNHPGFRDHFDLAGFSQAVAELTGGKVIVPVDPPAPTPVPPGPAPTPVPDPLADFPFQALNNWANHPHIWHPASVAAKQYEAWKARHHVGVS